MRKIFVVMSLFFIVIPQVSAATCPPCLTPLVCNTRSGVCEFPPPQGPPPPVCYGMEGVVTALGCIPTAPADLVQWILKYAILMGGGIAFLLSIWGGATILLSAGNPEKINEGREIITSAISGLLFIVLSIFLLRLVGVDILGLPDFSAQ